MDDNDNNDNTRRTEEEKRVFDAARTIMAIVVRQFDQRDQAFKDGRRRWPPVRWIPFPRTGNGLALACAFGRPRVLCTPWGGWDVWPLRDPEVAEIMRHVTVVTVPNMVFRVGEKAHQEPDTWEVMAVTAVDDQPVPQPTFPVEWDFEELTAIRRRLHRAWCLRHGFAPQDTPEW